MRDHSVAYLTLTDIKDIYQKTTATLVLSGENSETLFRIRTKKRMAVISASTYHGDPTPRSKQVGVGVEETKYLLFRDRMSIYLVSPVYK